MNAPKPRDKNLAGVEVLSLSLKRKEIEFSFAPR
jgi:hypothetical protein